MRELTGNGNQSDHAVSESNQFQNGRSLDRYDLKVVEVSPHLVDGRQQGQLQSLLPDRLARLEPRCSHSEVSLDLVPVFTILFADKRSSGSDKGERESTDMGKLT